jgi:hypothetical protein
MSIFFLLGAACIADGIYEISKKAKKEAEIRINAAHNRAAYNRKRYHRRVWN